MSSALLPTAREKIFIDTKTRVRLVSAINAGIDIDFFTMMLLCDNVSLAGPIPYALEFTKQSALQSIQMNWMVITKSLINSLFKTVKKIDFIRLIPRTFGKALAIKIVDNETTSLPLLAKKQAILMSLQEIAIPAVVSTATTFSSLLLVEASMSFIADQHNIITQSSEKCADLWKTFLLQHGITSSQVDKNVVTSWFRVKDMTNEPKELYFAENKAVKELWSLMTARNLQSQTNNNNILPHDFNNILPHLEHLKLVNAVSSAFYYTPGLGRGFLSYLELIARYHIPDTVKDDMRMYIAVRNHAELVIRTLINSVTYRTNLSDIREIYPNTATISAIEDIAYALFSGLFNFIFEARNDEVQRLCFQQLARNGFIVSSQWYDAELQPPPNGLPIQQHDTLKCISLKMYANLLMIIPQNYRISAFKEWESTFSETNNLVLAYFNKYNQQDEDDRIVADIINVMRNGFI